MAAIKIILPIYGQYDLVKKWVENIQHQDLHGLTLRIVAIDDSSKEADKSKIEEIFAPLKDKYKTQILMRLVNGGYTHAVNTGLLNCSNIDAVIFGNTDATYIHDHAIAHQYQALKSTGADIVGIRTMQNGMIHHDGILPDDKLSHIHYGHSPKDVRAGIPELKLVTGCGMMISSKVVKTLTPLIDYEHYGFQDIDLCARALQKGLKVVCDREVAMHHLVGMSHRDRDNSRFIEFFNRNKEKFFARYKSVL